MNTVIGKNATFSVNNEKVYVAGMYQARDKIGDMKLNLNRWFSSCMFEDFQGQSRR